jgi:hypothetical protein
MVFVDSNVILKVLTAIPSSSSGVKSRWAIGSMRGRC